jgi:sterol 3beta-glucosyltransferase
MPGLRLGGAANRASYAMMTMALAPYAGVINDFRADALSLPRRGRFANESALANGEPVLMLYAYSRHLLPVPPDYPPHVHVTGYWFLEQQQAWTPPADLAAFLAAGPPPVYVGFGSMSGAKAQDRTAIVVEALARAGQRGVLASGWGGMTRADLPANIFMLEEAPHDWLFPRVAAVVHHGGAGTTAAGLRAGKPTVIVPFIADQPFWGKIVHEQGAGPQPIAQKRLSAESLAAAIGEAVTDAEMQRRAAAIGEKIRAEDGAGNAVAIIERQIGRPSA